MEMKELMDRAEKFITHNQLTGPAGIDLKAALFAEFAVIYNAGRGDKAREGEVERR